MVQFSFYNKDGTLMRNCDVSKDLSNEIDTINIFGQFDVNCNRYELLTTMLKMSSNKFNKITVKDMPGESPKFLAFLVLICNKARHLGLYNCRLGDHATGCLMASLLHRNGLQELHINPQAMTTANAKLLLEGVTSSPCLEDLRLKIDIDGRQGAGDELIHTLRQNRSLKVLDIHLTPFDCDEFLPRLLNAAILETKVKSLTITAEAQQQLPISVLRELLCCSDCELETLVFSEIDVPVENANTLSEEPMHQNTSVREFMVSCTPNSEFGKTIKLFKSLVKLDLSWNNITSLQFLDPWLVDENSTLQSLIVSGNNIDSVEMKRFINQLHTMKNLKALGIGHCDWEDSSDDRASVAAALADAMSKNTSLEDIDVHFAKLAVALNRGGRRAFEPSESLPVNLWPELLARASRLKYYGQYNDLGHPTLTRPRADAVFWLLNRMTPQLCAK